MASSSARHGAMRIRWHYVEQIAAMSGMRIERAAAETLRVQRKQDVPGHVVVLRRT